MGDFSSKYKESKYSRRTKTTSVNHTMLNLKRRKRQADKETRTVDREEAFIVIEVVNGCPRCKEVECTQGVNSRAADEATEWQTTEGDQKGIEIPQPGSREMTESICKSKDERYWSMDLKG